MSSVWQTHAVDGREYYYNTETKQTTWDKPDALKSAAEREESSGGTATTWKEFTSASGKKYYYNSQTKETTWTMPDEMKSAETTSGIADAQSSADVPAAAPQATAPAAAAHTKGSNPAFTASAAVEATPAVAAAVETEEKRRFLAMLDATAQLSADTSWEQAMRLLLRDPSYKLLPTATDRKAAFLEWGEKRRMGEEEARRLEQRQLKVSFLGLLKEHTELTSRTHYERARGMCGADPRWTALDDDDWEREELYDEYQLSLERKEQTERREGRREHVAALRKHLDAQFGGGVVPWRRLLQSLDASAAAAQPLDRSECLQAVEEYLHDAELTEDQARRDAKEGARRRERQQRDAFRDLLRRKVDEGALTPRSTWASVLPALLPTVQYRAAVEQGGSTPSELFEDVVLVELKGEYAEHRQQILARAAATGVEISASTTIEELGRVVKIGAPPSGVPTWAVAEVLSELSRAQHARGESLGAGAPDEGARKRARVDDEREEGMIDE